MATSSVAISFEYTIFGPLTASARNTLQSSIGEIQPPVIR